MLPAGNSESVALNWETPLTKPVSEEPRASIRSVKNVPVVTVKALGEALLCHAGAVFTSEGLATMSLDVATNNPVARALYERMGFVKVGTNRSWRKAVVG